MPKSFLRQPTGTRTRGLASMTSGWWFPLANRTTRLEPQIPSCWSLKYIKLTLVGWAVTRCDSEHFQILPDVKACLLCMLVSPVDLLGMRWCIGFFNRWWHFWGLRARQIEQQRHHSYQQFFNHFLLGKVSINLHLFFCNILYIIFIDKFMHRCVIDI